jgi:glycosyltransferase involved in cell wall biosynthesis
MTVHIVYPFGPKQAAPWTIGNALADAFRGRGQTIEQYDWEDDREIVPRPRDILIGHPHPSMNRAFNKSMVHPWAKKIAICPWNGSQEYTAQVHAIIKEVDHFFPICGPYWAERLPEGWRGKSTPLNMAIDAEKYKQIKSKFAPVGSAPRRSILYIGCALSCKGPDFLSAISDTMPHCRFFHAGHGSIPGTTSLGYLNFADPTILAEIARAFDFIIAPGRNDANPTTILEAAAWGFLPISSDKSGWGPDISVIIPFGDVNKSKAIIDEWLNVEEKVLLAGAIMNRKRVENKYNWQIFTRKILEVFEWD